MKIGTCEVKNRIVMPPMMVGFGRPDGCPTEMLMDYYEERAIGGTGLIITEITRVNDVHGASAFNQLAMSHDSNIEPMKELVKRIHRHDTKLFVQLHHPGRQNVGPMVHTVPLTNAVSKVCKSFPNLIFKLAPKFADKLIEKTSFPHPQVLPNANPARLRADTSEDCVTAKSNNSFNSLSTRRCVARKQVLTV